MDWYDLTDKYHGQTLESDGNLLSLSQEWQRELAAIWRLEADVNNGTYLQFIENWDLKTHEYALRCLRNIGAKEMARIIEECHNLILKHTSSTLPEAKRFEGLTSNPVINLDGSTTTPEASPLPNSIIQKVYDLSYRFMDYPDNIAELGVAYYRSLADDDA